MKKLTIKDLYQNTNQYHCRRTENKFYYHHKRQQYVHFSKCGRDINLSEFPPDRRSLYRDQAECDKKAHQDPGCGNGHCGYCAQDQKQHQAAVHPGNAF